MSPSDWERIKELFASAVDLPEDERAAFLDSACAGDPGLRAELEGLLQAGTTDEFLEPPVTPPPFDAEGEPGLEGKVLGDFQILEKISLEGGGGWVYLASQISLDRKVAIKILPPHATLSPRLLERFHREARAAAKLKHPGIVPIHFVGNEGGIHYFAMEYIAGNDLHREIQLLREGGEAELPRPQTRASCKDVAALVADVADALQLAHENGIVHRDIKPQNLLLDPTGRLQIVDFGLARDESLGSITRSDERQGTPYYMSPEQAALSSVSVDHRTDIYSLGVVLYEMLTLRRPFEGRTSQEVLKKISLRDPRPIKKLNPVVPEDLATICGMAMSKERERRYSTAADLAADLRRFAAGAAVQARRPSVAYRTRRYAATHRTGVFSVAAAVAALVLGVLGSRLVQHSLARARLPRITVRTEPAEFVVDGVPVAPSVSLRPVSVWDPNPGDAIQLGSAPLEERRVEPGYYRIVVEVDGYGFAELSRELFEGAETEVLVARIRPTAGITAQGMDRNAGGAFGFANDELGGGCSFANSSWEIPSFWIDETEVSMGDYRAYLEETGREPPGMWRDWDVDRLRDDLPAVGMTWYEARDYAEWSGKRLLSHPEWELAGRGLEGRRFPWDDPAKDASPPANVHGTADRIRGGSPEALELYLRMAEPVTSRPEGRTPEGLHHMFGNASEWVDGKPVMWLEGEPLVDPYKRYSLGGGWDALANGWADLATHNFAYISDEFGRSDRGFRCGKSVRP